jgi:DinB family
VETRLEFIRRYAQDSGQRLAALRAQPESWYEGETTFFDVQRSRAWVLTRRLTHTSHHRGQQMAMLRMLGRDLHSNYGPTADTGGLMQNHAPTIYAYPGVEALLEGERLGGQKAPLPAAKRLDTPLTERPEASI